MDVFLLKFTFSNQNYSCIFVCEQTGGGLAQAILCGPGREHFLSPPLISGAILRRHQ